MKIPVTLNGSKVMLECQPDELLMKVLHKYGCSSVKYGCTRGFCGACTILLDDRPVASCKIPTAIIKDADIVTLDYFIKTEEYKLIMDGFGKAGIKLCGYCNAGKIFTAYQCLKMTKPPTRQEVAEQVRHLSPCCTDMETLVNGILYTISIRNQKIKRVT